MKGFPWLEKLLGGGPDGKKRMNALGWLIVVGMFGIAAMIFNSFITVKDADQLSGLAGLPDAQEAPAFGKEGKEPSGFEEIEARYEARMKDILEKIVGVGEVDILVTIDSTEELIVEKNWQQSQQVTDEKDKEGGTRHITDLTRNGEVVLYQVSGQQSPIVLKRVKPKIRGVLVVASGAENLTVRKLIIEAVERGLDAPSHRISVIPRKR